MILLTSSTGNFFKINGVNIDKNSVRPYYDAANIKFRLLAANTIGTSTNNDVLRAVGLSEFKLDGSTPADLNAVKTWVDTNCYSVGRGLSLQIVAPATSTSITHTALIGRTVSAVIINDTTKTTGFNQPNGSGLFLLTDSSTFTINDTVTFFFS